MTADNFYRNVMVSAGMHVLVFVLIMFRAAMVPTETIIIRNSIRVDVVGLPQKMREQVAAPVEKPAPAPVVEKPAPAPPAPKVLPKKVDPAPGLKPKVHDNLHKKQEEAMRRMSQESALDKLNEKTESKAKAKPAARSGNQISHGSASEGLDQTKADEYYNVVNDSVHNHWNLPQWLADQNIKAQVRVLIDERGYVIKKIWVKSSGNDVFDAKVIEAIDASSPLPAPPPGLRSGLASAGIGLNFP